MPGPNPPIPEERQYDWAKWLEENRRTDAQRTHDRYDALHDQQNQEAVLNGREGIKALILINGGAAITMLGFVGAFAARGNFDIKHLTPIANSLLWFAGGIVLAVIAFGFSYVANFSYAACTSRMKKTYEHPFVIDTDNSIWWRDFGVRFHYAAIGIAVLALALFLVGIWSVRNAIIAFV